MKWDTAADQHLLLAILSAHKVTVDHNRVAQIVGCTPRACEERIKKLRKLAKECGYEAQSPTAPLFGKKGGKRAGKGGKEGAGKGKCMDDADMILYRRGIVSDDIEVKMEHGMRIKREMIRREFGMSGYGGHGYRYEEDMKPFVKLQKMEDDSPFQFDPITSVSNVRGSPVSYANTAAGLEIPLGVPLEIAYKPLALDCRGGERYDFDHRAVKPLKKEFTRLPNRYTPSPKIPSPKVENSIRANESFEFVEISPASKKDPIIINDDDRGGACDAIL